MRSAILLQLLIQFLTKATELGNVLRQAQEEGRDVTPEELDEFVRRDDASRAALQEAIDRAKTEGR